MTSLHVSIWTQFVPFALANQETQVYDNARMNRFKLEYKHWTLRDNSQPTNFHILCYIKLGKDETKMKHDVYSGSIWKTSSPLLQAKVLCSLTCKSLFLTIAKFAWLVAKFASVLVKENSKWCRWTVQLRACRLENPINCRKLTYSCNSSQLALPRWGLLWLG